MLDPPCSRPRRNSGRECESLSRREKPWRRAQASAQGRGTMPNGQEGLADGGSGKLRGLTRMADAPETVPVTVTAANANRLLIT